MEYIIIISAIVSAISAYFILRAQIKYPIKLIGNAVLLLLSLALMALTGWKDLSIFIYIIIVIFTILGISAHFLAPLLFNAIGRALAEMTKQKYQDMTYDELLYDGHRIYFAVLLFTTVKIFLYTLLICACAGIVR